MTPFSDPAVEAHFASYPARARRKLLAVRELIFATAAQTPGVGELQEALKWGEPAYLTARTKSGSTLRIDWKPRSPDEYAIYFHCRTGLVENFRALFPKDFRFEGNRALLLDLAAARVPTDALSFCIRSSLTYHARKRAAAGRPGAAT